MRKALITGITGQDGSYLAELLLEKDYVVHGLVRRSSSFNTKRIDHLYQSYHNEGNKFIWLGSEDSRLFLHHGDLSTSGQLIDLISEIRPDEIYHLGAQSHVRVSFDMPEYTGDITGLATIRLLEAVRKVDKNIKFYQASSSEMFGSSPPPQNESTSFNPRSPYGVAKVYAFYVAKNYREAYDMFVCNGILFNHESERRGETFVSRKITRGATRIKFGLQDKLYLGNLEAKRDWGYAKDYVEAMWLMLQNNSPDDFVISTGKTRSVKEFVDLTFKELGMDYKDYVEIDKKYYRPTEVDVLLGDSSKAKEILRWKPKTSFKEMVKKMIKNDIMLANGEKIIKELEEK